MTWPKTICAMLLIFFLSSRAFIFAEQKSTSHLIVSFPSGDKMMLGYMYRPTGNGPFPTVIFNHGSHKNLTTTPVAEFEALGQFFTSRGYLLFLPDRHPQSFLPGEFSASLQQKIQANPTGALTKDQRMIETLEIINRDVTAAAEWLKKQPDVQTNRIAMMGLYSGAAQTILTAEKDPGLRSVISFFPGVTTWKESMVFQGVMSSALRKMKAPAFLIFVKNNPNLDPADVLGEELQKKGKPNRTKVYPAFGKPDEFGRKFVIEGINVWGADVEKFLEETMK